MFDLPSCLLCNIWFSKKSRKLFPSILWRRVGTTPQNIFKRRGWRQKEHQDKKKKTVMLRKGNKSWMVDIYRQTCFHCYLYTFDFYKALKKLHPMYFICHKGHQRRWNLEYKHGDSGPAEERQWKLQAVSSRGHRHGLASGQWWCSGDYSNSI